MLPPKLRVKVTALRQTVLASQSSGHITELAVRDGDLFTKDQVLARLDCSMQKAQLKRAEAAAHKQQSFYETTLKLERMRSRSPLELAAAKADAAQAAAELLVAQTMVERCTITAPFSGRVGERLAQENQFVSEGQPLLEILDPSELELEFIVPVIIPFLVGLQSRAYAACFSFMAGVIPPMPMLGRSLL